MERQKKYKNAEEWVNQQLAEGRFSFSLKKFRMEFTHLSSIAIKFALKRLVDKKLVISIQRGFYLILLPQYKSKEILPPYLFLDALMNHLERPYYLGLLNAASIHGASHQQPQEYFIITNFPVIRPIFKNGLKINFVSRKHIASNLLENQKTEAGYLKISNPILTALDLVQNAKQIGGLNKVSSILFELMESVSIDSIDANLLNDVQIAVLQRLGYLLEFVLGNTLLANKIFQLFQDNKIKLTRIPLKPSNQNKSFLINDKWKIIVNESIELDE